MGFEVVLIGAGGVEMVTVEFYSIEGARAFAKAGMKAKGVKRTLILSFGDKFEGFQFDSEGNVQSLIFQGLTAIGLFSRIGSSVQYTSLRFETMTAEQIWKNDGLITSNGTWMLVSLHKIGERANKPEKNLRFPYQTMMNDVNQSLPVKFRSLKAALSFFNGEMDANTFSTLVNEGKAKMYFGPGKQRLTARAPSTVGVRPAGFRRKCLSHNDLQQQNKI